MDHFQNIVRDKQSTNNSLTELQLGYSTNLS